LAGVVKAGGEGVGARGKDESMAEVNLGGIERRCLDGRERHVGETL
jgi:hypothetical protein